MTEYPQEFLEDSRRAASKFNGHLSNESFISMLDVIHDFLSGKYGEPNTGIPDEFLAGRILRRSLDEREVHTPQATNATLLAPRRVKSFSEIWESSELNGV